VCATLLGCLGLQLGEQGLGSRETLLGRRELAARTVLVRLVLVGCVAVLLVVLGLDLVGLVVLDAGRLGLLSLARVDLLRRLGSNLFVRDPLPQVVRAHRLLLLFGPG
jgi:hypothetical protein